MGVLFILVSVKRSMSVMLQLSDYLSSVVILLYMDGSYILCSYGSKLFMLLIYIMISLMLCWAHMSHLCVADESLIYTYHLLMSWFLGFMIKFCHSTGLLVCYLFSHICVGWTEIMPCTWTLLPLLEYLWYSNYLNHISFNK